MATHSSRMFRKTKSDSCEIVDVVETPLCKLRGILRSRVLRTGFEGSSLIFYWSPSSWLVPHKDLLNEWHHMQRNRPVSASAELPSEESPHNIFSSAMWNSLTCCRRSGIGLGEYLVYLNHAVEASSSCEPVLWDCFYWPWKAGYHLECRYWERVCITWEAYLTTIELSVVSIGYWGVFQPFFCRIWVSSTVVARFAAPVDKTKSPAGPQYTQ